MIRVTVTGSECTGKTTLASALAERFATVWVPEYAREFVADVGRPPDDADVEAIARGQMAREDELAARAEGLLILDTDLLSTWVYSRHYYGRCPDWIDTAVRDRLADLYLLTGIDVPWMADGVQRDRGDRREEMQALFRRELVVRRSRFVEVRGPLARRVEISSEAIARLLGR